MPKTSFEEYWRKRGYFVFESVIRPNSKRLGKANIPAVGIFRKSSFGSRDCEHRFLLKATVNADADSTVGILAMNPSKALRIAGKSDHTVSRLINFFRLNPDLGYGSILVGNCFAKYETNSANVKRDSQDITEINDTSLKYLFESCREVIIATGGVPVVKDRLLDILKHHAPKCSLTCFRQDGWVGCHPSRGSYDDWRLMTYDQKKYVITTGPSLFERS